MKEGTFYLPFVLFILAFAISGRISSDSVPEDISSCELSIEKAELNCTVPQVKEYQKKILPIINSTPFLQNRVPKESFNRQASTSLLSLKQKQLKLLVVKPDKLLPSELRLYPSSENPDEHHLS